MALSGCCSTQKKYENLVVAALTTNTNGKNLAEALKYLSASQVSNSQ